MPNRVQGHRATRPTPEPLHSSVLDHASVVENQANFPLINNEGLWPSYNMLDLFNTTRVCPRPTDNKRFEFAPWAPAFNFTVYGAVQCGLVGLDHADQEAEVRRVFETTEGRGVERALLENRFVERVRDNSLILPERSEWDAPVDLTPAVAAGINVKTALALLEGYGAANYAGQITVHMPRTAVSLISDMVQWDGDKAFTPAGSKIAVGGGYDDPSENPGPLLDIYATGEVYVEKSEKVLMKTWELNGDANPVLDANTGATLVQRSYRAAVDGFVAKATGTLWAA